ncbi:uncharacterized protein LOC126802763 [Argentina anserina]|uniref:uncharacterized protein LOC126802763 n=1 Tax=Argentina anserina TaxID=57926 RepID=UPI0021764D3E|nr:uncharacterized protein LOC126802763 [Potentilla anserina]
MEAVFPPPPATTSNTKSLPKSKPPRQDDDLRTFITMSKIQEIRVCTNRSCRRQGSMQTLESISITALAPPTVAVKSCGCLSRCALLGHCGTTARAREVLVALCGAGDWDSGAADKNLKALALRNKAEIELLNNNFSHAELVHI